MGRVAAGIPADSGTSRASRGRRAGRPRVLRGEAAGRERPRERPAPVGLPIPELEAGASRDYDFLVPSAREVPDDGMTNGGWVLEGKVVQVHGGPRSTVVVPSSTWGVPGDGEGSNG